METKKTDIGLTTEFNEDSFIELAGRIKELREICDYSVEDMAKALGVQPDIYMEYEKTGRDVPISVIYQMSKMFGVDFSEILTGTSAKLNEYQVVRNGKGQRADRYPGYKFQDLAYHFANTIMQPLIVTLDPSDEPAELVSHKGEEFNYVLEGTVILTFAGKEILLNQGDSIYFNPNYPHGQRCGGKEPAVFLTMIAE